MTSVFTVARVELDKLRTQRALPLALFASVLLTKATALVQLRTALNQVLDDVQPNGFFVVARGARDGLALAGVLLFLGAALSIAAEAERGQLRPLLTRPVGRGTLLLGRLVALAAVASVVVLVDAASGFLAGLAGGGFADVADPDLQGEQYGAHALAFDALAAYAVGLLALWAACALGLLVSTLARGAAGAVLGALLLLLLLVVAGGAFGAPLEDWLLPTWLWRPFDVLGKLALGTSLYRAPGEALRAALATGGTLVFATAAAVLVFRRRDQPQ